jgi:PDZ domain-containing secreted protein
MKNQTFKIGGTDYEVRKYIGYNQVNFSKIPRVGEVKEEGQDYDSVEDGISQIVNESIKDYKKYVLTIEEAKKQLKRQYHGVLALEIGNKKSGYIVIISKIDLDKMEYSSDYDMVKYCRGKKAAEEITIDCMKPKVTETTNYTESQMFQLNHGMSWERYMST